LNQKKSVHFFFVITTMARGKYFWHTIYLVIARFSPFLADVSELCCEDQGLSGNHEHYRHMARLSPGSPVSGGAACVMLSREEP
jgi:hypothetical protein